MTPLEERRNETRMYNPQIISDLQAWTDTVNPVQTHSHVSYQNHSLQEKQKLIHSKTDYSHDLLDKLVGLHQQYLFRS